MSANFKILCLCLLLAGCGNGNESEYFSGYLEGDYRYLAPSTSGRIVKINVKEGQHVKAGELLFELENTAQTANLSAANENLNALKAELADLNLGKREQELETIRAQIAEAKSGLWAAEQNYKRAVTLKKQSSISQKEFDAAKAEFDRQNALVKQLVASLEVANLPARINQIKSLEAKIKAAEANMQSCEYELNKTRLAANESGLIERVFYKEGEWASSTRPVLSLLPPNELKVRFFVPASVLPMLKEGQKVKLSCQNCPKFSATISQVATQPEYTPPVIYTQNQQNTLTYRIEAVPDEPSEFLHPSQPVEVRLR